MNKKIAVLFMLGYENLNLECYGERDSYMSSYFHNIPRTFDWFYTEKVNILRRHFEVVRYE